MEDLFLKALDEVALEGPEGNALHASQASAPNHCHLCHGLNKANIVSACCGQTCDAPSADDVLCMHMLAGCPVPRLWELLEQRPEDKVTLPEGLRQALWSCLLQRLTDISVCNVERRVPDRCEECCVP